MDFNITVGILSQLKNQGDYQGFKYFQPVFPALCQALEDGGQLSYREPAHLSKYWSVSMKHSDIYYLRRFAAHIALCDRLPEPCESNPAADPCYLEYLDTLGLAAVKYRFDHLFFHSDCSGFYLPVDFEEVLYPEWGLDIPGDMIGSSYRLRDECRYLSEWLGLSLDGSFSEERKALMEGTDGGNVLPNYSKEAYVCSVLYRASMISIELGAAIVFHESGMIQQVEG